MPGRTLLLLALLPVAASAAERLPTPTQRAAGLERRDGFLPFYWDAARGQLLLEVARWGEELLYGAGLAGGAGVLEVSPRPRPARRPRAWCASSGSGPRVLLHQRQTAHRSGVPTASARAWWRSRSRPRCWPRSRWWPRRAAACWSTRPTSCCATPSPAAPQARRAGRLAAGRGPLRPSTSSARGAFPRNTEIEAVLTFTSEDPPRAVAAVLPDGRTHEPARPPHLLKLPEPGYVPRPLDPRVGFIPQPSRTTPRPYRAARALARLALAAREEGPRRAASPSPSSRSSSTSTAACPSPSAPRCAQAALWWNHAFEAAGFKDALVVRDLPEGATFLDARYSGIEWIHRAERAWSIGDFQADPRTGEILHAVARIDSHRRRTTSRMWRNLRDPRACAAADAPDVLAAGPGAGASEQELSCRGSPTSRPTRSATPSASITTGRRPPSAGAR